jgi:hypothetical protein
MTKLGFDLDWLVFLDKGISFNFANEESLLNWLKKRAPFDVYCYVVASQDELSILG